MTDDNDIDAIAGEYVLGTLDAGERASVAARRLREPALDAAIQEWERRLAPLAELVPAVAPPGDALAKIEARIDGKGTPSAGSATIVDLRRRLNLWRTTAIAASAIAASLILALGVRDFQPKPKQQNLVAVLQKDAASPAFLVTVNIEDRTMIVQPVATKPEPGKSYELWIVQDSLGAPKSLGVIDEPKTITRPTLAAYKPDVIESATFAVSLEPEGGSPTGLPTGPVVFSGKLIPAR
ncbi:anti-sigma factor [Hyphomicrobium facile]|uniref:Anti-sigma-K factor RskA n=1 Tax=Hyphomicrobium facile TaxID=51670 RepID=A0A1I7NU55_9HYPH|nr:anti-sigma factor [Hyphomicrobium facile]SFV38209.1 Anti-sigma-K factor RskA [Hyphomicrobium facile]